MFAFLKKSPPPDADLLKAATHKIVDGLLSAEPQVGLEPFEPRQASSSLGSPVDMHAALGMTVFMRQQLEQSVPSSTLHHWALSAHIQLTPEEAAIQKHIEPAMNEGYRNFQSYISNIPTLAAPGELRFIAGNEYQFTLPLQTLHSPENFMQLMRKSHDVFHQAVERRATIASLPHATAHATAKQQPQR